MRRLLPRRLVAAASLATLLATATTASAQLDMPFGISPAVGRGGTIQVAPSVGVTVPSPSAPSRSHDGYRTPAFGYGFGGYGSGYRSPAFGYGYGGYGGGYRSPAYGYGYGGYGSRYSSRVFGLGYGGYGP